MQNKMSILTAVPDPHFPAMPAMPATRSCSLDSVSLSGSLSDSGFASSSSTPPTIDTAATSDDDDEPHEPHEKEVVCESPRMMIMEGHHRHHLHLASSSNPNPKPKPSRNSSYDSPSSPSPSLLRTTLLSFARIGLSTSSTSSPTSYSSPSRSRCSSISIPASGSGSDPSSSGSPLPSPTSLHAKSTTEIYTNSNPSLAQFIPTPGASSSLARYCYSSSSSSISRTHPPRSRSVSNVQTAHVGSSPRLRTHHFDDLTSAHTQSVTPPFSFWRKRTTPHSHSHSHAPHPSPLVLPSISRAHVPDYLPDPVLPIDKANPSSRSSLGSPSTPCPSGFLKIDGSRDGLSFRTAENATRANGPNLIVGTPRPSYPIGLDSEHDDNVDIMVVDSPVGDDDDEQPNNENAGQCGAKGKGKQPATILAHHSASSASIPIPSQQQPQLRVKIILPPPPVRASTTPLPKRTKPTPPTLTSVEKSSRLMRDRVHCATCATVGVDFPRCPRCAEAWCSRECRVARMDELPDGRRKHVCKA